MPAYIDFISLNYQAILGGPILDGVDTGDADVTVAAVATDSAGGADTVRRGNNDNAPEDETTAEAAISQVPQIGATAVEGDTATATGAASQPVESQPQTAGAVATEETPAQSDQGFSFTGTGTSLSDYRNRQIQNIFS